MKNPDLELEDDLRSEYDLKSLRGCLKSPTIGIKTPDPPSPLEKGEPESGS